MTGRGRPCGRLDRSPTRQAAGATDRSAVPGRPARALVVGEEEQLVLHDRAAQRAAEDVLLALRLGRARAVVLPAVRVDVAVAVELEHVAAELVGAGLDDAAEHGAAHVAGVGRVVVGLDADLGERVGAGLVGDAVVDGLVHVEAVEHVVVRLLAVAVHERTAVAERRCR